MARTPIAVCFFLCQFAAVATYAESGTDTSQNNSARTSTLLQSPATPKAVLLNLKYALQHDLFLQREFYTQENFRWFLGENHVTANANNSPTEQDFRLAVDETNATNPCIQSGGVRWFLWKTSEEGSAKAGGDFGMRARYAEKHIDPRRPEVCIRLNVDTVQEVFGKAQSVVPIFPKDGTPPPHGRSIVFGAKTHPLGHTDITYDLGDALVNRRASFEIIGNGLVRSIGINSTERSGE